MRLNVRWRFDEKVWESEGKGYSKQKVIHDGEMWIHVATHLGLAQAFVWREIRSVFELRLRTCWIASCSRTLVATHLLPCQTRPPKPTPREAIVDNKVMALSKLKPRTTSWLKRNVWMSSGQLNKTSGWTMQAFCKGLGFLNLNFHW